ncbi:diacylglycerol/lipid kinase family protein [Devriesea agamarum]|uniref:diacylglycerol/lipid kinase family protein n=1 Tax=Devriesea agamarum TaxID=472569 RepID=UPI00071D08B6|nr:diacylglycerol kinase family protein [Devriesea agamarum]
MSRLRVGLLINPAAASGTAHRIGVHVSTLLKVAGISVVDVTGRSARTAQARALVVRDDLTALIVVGGDGTVSLGAEIVAQTPVRLGIVPAGSGNDLARSLGLPIGKPDEAVRTLLRALSRPVIHIDAIEMSSLDDSAAPHRSLALGCVNLGFDALVNARANSAKSGFGKNYTVAVMQELRHFHEIPYWIEIDGGPRQELDASLLTLCNGAFCGGGMQLVPQARLNDGHLDLAMISGLSRPRLLRMFPRVFRGAHLSVPQFSVRPVRSVTIGVRDGRLLRSYADGEARTVLPLSARVLPGAVRILADSSAPCLSGV